MKVRKILALAVTVMMLLTTIALPTPLSVVREAEALSCTYNPTLAISKAPEILNTAVSKGWGGATYVDKVLRAGGLNLGSSTLSGAGDLLDYLNTPSKFGGSIGQVVINPTGSQLHKGDVLTVVCYKGGNSSDYTNGHSKGAGKYYGLQTCIVSEVVSNTQVRYYQAHNERRNATLTLSTFAKGFTCSKCGNNTYVKLVAFCFNDAVKQYPVTVSFSANGGSVSTSSKTAYYNTTYGTLPTPTRSGYSFAGWYTASSGGSYVTSSTKVTATGNHTLYAHWNVALPSITTQPSSVSVNEGATATFKVVASGATAYQWQYKKPDESTWTNVSNNGTSATYSLTTAARHNGYTYRCKVSNAAGNVYSSTAQLTVKFKPIITTQPSDKTVNPGATATFKVVATGATAYQWQYKKPGESTWNNVSNNGTSATYSLTTAARHNGYIYRCKVSNAVGSVYSSTAKLTVGNPGKPSITTQPSNKTVNAGAKATFKVVATGATAYQWQYKKPGESTWNNISNNGTSATYSLTTAARHNGYVYRCKVSNAVGSVYSNTVKLTVKATTKYRALLIGVEHSLFCVSSYSDVPSEYRSSCLSINGYYFYIDITKRNTGDTSLMQNMLNNVYGGKTAGSEYQITRKIDPSYSQIKSLIQTTFSETTDNDVSLFFIATHGDSNGDGNLTMPYTQTLTESNIRSYVEKNEYDLPFSTLASWLGQYVKGDVIVIIESCGAGSAIYYSDAEQNDMRTLTSIDENQAASDFVSKAISTFAEADSKAANSTGDLRKPRYYVLAAARHHELSYGSESLQRNVFTKRLVDGVGSKNNMPADDNSNGIVDLTELFNYIKKYQNNDNQHVQRYPVDSTYPLFRGN